MRGIEVDRANSTRADLVVDAAKAKVVTVTHTPDTAQLASGDLAADTQEIASAVRIAGESVILQSITLIDKADQGSEIYFVFLNASTSLGTENSAPSISDANAANIIGVVKIATTDYVDVGGAKVACKTGIGLVLKAAADQTSIWVAIVNSTGTQTYGASELVAQYAFLRE